MLNKEVMAMSNLYSMATPEQKQAIESRGHNILVSASAGSGKTWVMGHRVVKLLMDGVSIKSLFISTFTNKAGEELRIRIGKFIKEALRQDLPLDVKTHLQQSLQDLPDADIGTLDAFSNRFVKRHFNLINIDPNFAILTDPTEAQLLYLDVLDGLIETYLDGQGKIGDKDFTDLVDQFSSDRSLEPFKDLVLGIYRQSQSSGNPDEWLKKQLLDPYDKFTNRQTLPDDVKPDLRGALQAIDDAIDLAFEREILKTPAVKKAADGFKALVPQLYAALDQEDYGLFAQLFLNDLPKGFVPSRSKKGDEVLESYKDDLRDTREQYWTFIENSSKFYARLPIIETYHADAKRVMTHLQIFVRDFSQQLLARKLVDNRLDFSDVSHFTIQILTEHQELREAYQAQYAEVMIDEYQDANDINEDMINLLSNGHNLFMVGDMKQGIYGFRQADLTLFSDKYDTYTLPYEPGSPGELILLKENFRSSQEVLNFTNEVFTHLMDRTYGGLVYDDQAQLVVGNPEFVKTPHPEFKAEYLLGIKRYQQAGLRDYDLLAREIQRLNREDGVPYSDMAILVKTKTNNNDIEDTLVGYDIPVVLDEGRQEYLESLEIKVMLAVLRTINNPFYDIPLVATLRSPLFKFNEEDLAQIAVMGGSDTTFWHKMALYKEANSDNALSTKIDNFIDKRNQWLTLSQTASISQLIWQIYLDTYYYEYVGAMPNGEMRQANLQALTSRAENFERNGYKGLYSFIQYIDTYMMTNNDLANVNLRLPQNAVTVMTIHKSKGLEFPYVFVVDMDKGMNIKNLTGDFLTTKKYGMGIQYTADVKSSVETDFPFALLKMETLPFLVNKEQWLKDGLSEAMRVFYVAMTRAVNKVYFVGELQLGKDETEWESKFGAASLTAAGILNNQLRRGTSDDKQRGQSFQGWVLGLAKTGVLKGLSIQAVELTDLAGPEDASTQLTKGQSFQELAEAAKKVSGQVDYDQVAKAREILDYDYPHKFATQLASVQTPSQIKKRYEGQLDQSEIVVPNEFQKVQELRLLSLTTDNRVSAAEVGTATHELMQVLDFTNVSRETIQDTLKTSVRASKKVKDAVKIDRILEFFDTDLGLLLTMNASAVEKEVHFSMLKQDAAADDAFIVRGIMDGYLALPDRLILFDYKTDHFTSDAAIPEIMDRYRLQMDLYAQALAKAKGQDQVEKYLILLGGVNQIEIAKL
jgi:ATP-dependent helicase/nuclease subunit A